MTKVIDDFMIIIIKQFENTQRLNKSKAYECLRSHFAYNQVQKFPCWILLVI